MNNRLINRIRFTLILIFAIFFIRPASVSAQNGWTTAAPVTSARFGTVTGVIDGKIYVAGGYDTGYLNTLEVYDPALNTWSALAPMPAGIYLATGDVIGGKLYVAGGSDGISPVATLFVYDPVMNSWSTLAPMPTARFLASSGAINGKLYVAGGTVSNTGTSTDKLEVYDPTTNTWATKAPMPESGGRYDAGGAVLSNKFYVAGGYGDTVSYSKLLEVYDPLTDSWTAKAPMPQFQLIFAALALNGQLYAIGGQDSTSAPLNIVQVYEPTTDTWSNAPAMPTARFGLSAEAVGNSIYALGGHNGSAAFATHEVFTLPSCAPSPAGLVGWWAGDGDARDNTGVNNGTLNVFPNHSGMTVGHIGQSFFLQQATFEYVAVPDNNSLEMTTQFTLAAWVRQLGTYPPDQQIISKFGTFGNYAYQFSLSSNGGVRMDFSADGTNYGALIAPNNSITPGVWQYVAATFNAGNVKLYVNGIEVASGTSSITSIYSNGTAPLNIGRDAGGAGQYFSGLIDEAMVFNRALSATEINDIFALGKKGVCKSAATSAGANSQTQVGDQTITFQSVNTPGATTSFTLPPLDAGDLPANYTHTGLAYDISTTASFTGPVQICFNLPSVMSQTAQTNLRVLHNEGGTLVDRTTGRMFSSSMLCASVTSLSPFVIAAAATPTAAPASVSGEVLTTGGVPLGGVVVELGGAHRLRTITDAAGHYKFDGIESGNFYTITPSRAGYSFNPRERSFSLISDKTDATFTAAPDAIVNANPLDTDLFFVRQHYLDFLGREPDTGGLAYWATQFAGCRGDASCLNQARINISAAFFIEQEFQETGSFIYRLYKASYGVRPLFAQFMPDRKQLVGGADLEANKNAFVESWIQRPEFTQRYPQHLSGPEFIDALLKTLRESSSIDTAEMRSALLNDYQTHHSRARIVRMVADDEALRQAEYNSAFVLMQYFGYLRRDPDEDGYRFWLNVLDTREPNNYRGMVCSFITSKEYQYRFSPVATSSNADCR